MKLPGKLLTAIFLLTLVAGCMNFDYVGQSFAPHSESVPVTFYENRAAIPRDTYRIIGRGILSGPENVDGYDIMAELRFQARKHGADAVCTVSTVKKQVGIFPAVGDDFSEPLSPGANRGNLSPSGTPWQTTSFGETPTLKSQEAKRYEFETKVIFLKKIDRFDAEMKSRGSVQ